MRTIKKTITVKTIEQTIYNRTTKVEEVKKFDVAEFQETPTAEPDCVVLDTKVLEEKEIVYTMSPETFFKNATLELPTE